VFAVEIALIALLLQYLAGVRMAEVYLDESTVRAPDFWLLAASPQKSRKSRSDELIAGWKALKQTLRACL